MLGCTLRSLFSTINTTGRQSSTVAAVATSTKKIASIRALANKLLIDWTDGITAQFPYVWLRDCAPTTRSSLADFTLNVRPERLQLIEHGAAVCIDWPPYCRSIYESSWLRDRIIPARVPTDHDNIEYWCKSTFVLPQCTIDQLRVDGGQVCDELLQRTGVVKIRNCHHIDEILSLIGVDTQLIGTVGDQHLNTARSLQTGMPERSEIPQLMLANVTSTRAMLIRATLTLVDGYHVAEQLRSSDPGMFDFLTRTPIEYVPSGGGGGISAEHRLIAMRADAIGFNEIVFNNAQRSRRMSTLKNVDDLEYLYRCLQTFHRICYRNAVGVELNNGDVLLLMNRRVLHGNPAQYAFTLQTRFANLVGG